MRKEFLRIARAASEEVSGCKAGQTGGKPEGKASGVRGKPEGKASGVWGEGPKGSQGNKERLSGSRAREAALLMALVDDLLLPHVPGDARLLPAPPLRMP